MLRWRRPGHPNTNHSQVFLFNDAESSTFLSQAFDWSPGGSWKQTTHQPTTDHYSGRVGCGDRELLVTLRTDSKRDRNRTRRFRGEQVSRTHRQHSGITLPGFRGRTRGGEKTIRRRRSRGTKRKKMIRCETTGSDISWFCHVLKNIYFSPETFLKSATC